MFFAVLVDLMEKERDRIKKKEKVRTVGHAQQQLQALPSDLIQSDTEVKGLSQRNHSKISQESTQTSLLPI